MIVAERTGRLTAEAKLAVARAEAANIQADLTSTEALIAHLRLAIEKLRRELYGSRSEHKARLLDQMELKLEELEAAASEDELAAHNAAAQTERVTPFTRRRLSRRSFPEHLPRERVVIAAPQTCPCCGSTRLSKLGEDVTETLEVIPRRACATALRPLYGLIEAHVLSAERLHGDDTTVPILAKGKTVTGRIWTYVRDDRPFGSRAPPAALYYASRDRAGAHPERHLHGFCGI